ncbi:hypothetical protein ACM46_08735 [Chryseobacterium angstadtii]|uniref:Cytochrome C551 n=1 Tax=Chryseobacterium angstadtii TaxID=558151 RepID=A0A0J7IEM1_9FLAO|nr:hypothetical protein [Chryseobacterium angstadtii]KMQ64366.1 hypothetical protein ACM46_08735 [Chryseobacterium angstadtii]
MKKFLLGAIGLGLVVVSCGTKESTMSAKSSDSVAVSSQKAEPATADTASVKKVNTDTMKVKVDSTATKASAK